MPTRTPSPHTGGLVPASVVERVITLAVVLLPMAGFALAAVAWWNRGVGTVDLLLFAVMYLVTAGGIAMGFHRLFTHRSFRARTGLRWALGIAGSMAAQGPLLFWVACHRRHHQHSDGDADPHSPHRHGRNGAAIVRGWLHAHIGWLLRAERENYLRYAAELARDPVARGVHRTYLLWLLLGLAGPAAIAGWAGGIEAFYSALLWGGFARVFAVHHVTWSVNSVCHLFGSAPFATGDESRNHPVVALLSLGEGWHNNHHAFPTSARHGLRWWELDIVYLVTRALAWMGLVHDVRVPAPAETARRVS